MVVYAARLTMNDDFSPSISGLSGTLLQPGDLRDTASLEVFGTDRGSGLRTVAVEIDGHIVVEQRFQASSSRCQEPYTRPQPCALGGSHGLRLDTRRLADGAHRTRVLLRDAAGNTRASRFYSIAVNNGGASCPYGSGPKLKVGFGRRRTRGSITIRAQRRALLSGRLLSQNGPPVAGAAVRVLTQGAGSSEWRQVALPATNRTGRFRVRLPKGPSRRVRVTYCGKEGGHYRDLRLRAQPSTGLRTNRRRARNGQSVVFSGRLRSGPIPRGGKLVELQAFFRGRWRTFQTLHTRRKGTFQFRYWFGGTRGTVRYRFRARVPREGGYPYTTGASRRVTVTVSG
ncbi:MAG: carboxypeptidase-like regulatory domain-containing protein [Actinomycetota bacterium]|nr:carboxypeptidase-like regulatory domain-containing protein [Actinomycetota bacterium]MDQ3647990.1 carboxypeptidase-like regulatory domain-containing protein [Actinomycetota bacterium]